MGWKLKKGGRIYEPCSSLKKAPQEYLSLSPLIVDTHSEVLDSPEKIRNVKKDIFLYSKWDKERIHYVGTQAPDRCDLRSLSDYDLLCRELDEYFVRFGEGV